MSTKKTKPTNDAVNTPPVVDTPTVETPEITLEVKVPENKKSKTKKSPTTTKSQVKIQQPIAFNELFTNLKKENNFITPRNLESLFNLEQPIVRRHLRSHFMPQFEHELGQKWQMGIDLTVTKDVLTYFYERFEVILSDDKNMATS